MKITTKCIDEKKLLLIKNDTEFASVQIWIKAGSANEKHPGIAHFLEHMLFKPSTTRPKTTSSLEAEKIGGMINAFTSYNYTCFYINCRTAKINQALDILLDMISYPNFDSPELIPERNVVFEEYQEYYDRPGSFAMTKIQDNFFNKAYHPIIGSAKSIPTLSKDKLTDYYNSHYHQGNILVVIAGNYSNLDVLKKYSFKKGKTTPTPTFTLKNNPILIHHKDVKQATISKVLPASDVTSKYTAIEELIIAALGIGENSYLHKNLVLTGLASSVNVSSWPINNSRIVFTSVTLPSENIKSAVIAINKAYQNLYYLTASELDRIKGNYLAKQIYAKESFEDYSFHLASNYLQYLDPFMDDKLFAKIDKVTIRDFKNHLPKFLKPSPLISLQLPLNDKKNYTSYLKFNYFLAPKIPKFNIVKSKFDKKLHLINIKPGIDLLHRFNDLTPSFDMQIYLQGGLIFENSTNNGIYNQLSTLLTRGNINYDYNSLNLELEKYSAKMGSFSGKSSYGITLHGLSTHFDTTVDLLMNSLLYPSFPKDLLDLEVNQTCRQIAELSKDPFKILMHNFDQQIFNGHPYSLHPLGTVTDIKKLQVADLNLVHKQTLQNKRILIATAGNLSQDELIKKIYPYLNNLNGRKFSYPKFTSHPKLDKKHISINREQLHIFMGFPTKSIASSSSIILKMLTTYLQASSSPLFTVIRDKLGLCYTCAPINFISIDRGYFGIYISTTPNKYEQAISEIKKVLLNLDINISEFNKLKEIIRSNHIFQLQTNEDYLNLLSSPVILGLGLDYNYQLNKKISELSFSKFKKQSKEIFNRPMGIVTVGKH